MTVEEHDSIDMVAHNPERDEALLVMVEHREWSDRGELLPDLQAKLNTYLAYATEGQLAKDFPALSGKQVHIQVFVAAPPTARELQFLRLVSEHHLQPLGICLSWKLLTDNVAHGV